MRFSRPDGEARTTLLHERALRRGRRGALPGSAALQQALEKAGTDYRLEWYPGAQHGFAFPQRAGICDKPSAERHWQRLFALFSRNLRE